MKLAFVVGARPNFMKVAPVLAEMSRRERETGRRVAERLVVHTGQHYDAVMSDVFFRDLGMPPPDECLEVGSGTHGRQTASVMAAFDDVCERRRPDGVVVAGDVNSTMACALVAAKMGIGVAHLEAGLRSYDRTMPEEINRVVTDQVTDLLLTTCQDSLANLAREGVDPGKVTFVGNPMIDSLTRGLEVLGDRPSELAARTTAAGHPYFVVTLHRPGNVDDVSDLLPILDGLRDAATRAVAFFPIHPRTSKRLSEAGHAIPQLDAPAGGALACGLYGLPPLAYLDFINLMRGATLVLTDSGGIQEETTVLGVPCATLRPNTERPVTVTLGTNEIVPRTAAGITAAAERALSGRWKRGTIPPLWDGRAAGRIVDALLDGRWCSR